MTQRRTHTELLVPNREYHASAVWLDSRLKAETVRSGNVAISSISQGCISFPFCSVSSLSLCPSLCPIPISLWLLSILYKHCFLTPGPVICGGSEIQCCVGELSGLSGGRFSETGLWCRSWWAGTSKITLPGTLGSAIQVLRKTVNTFSFVHPWYPLSTPFSVRTRVLDAHCELFLSEDAAPLRGCSRSCSPRGRP